MGAAKVSALEAVRASKQWDTLRQQLHARFDQWLETLEQQWHEPPSTLPEVTAMVWDRRQRLTSGLTETIIAQGQRGAHDRTQAPCPRCAEGLKARECVCRTVDTLGGSVQVERPYCYCRPCHVGDYPVDDAVGLVAGCKQLDRHKAAAHVVTEVPYATAQALLRTLTGISLGSERLHTMGNHVAEDLTVGDVTPSREESTARVAAVAAGRWRRPVLVLGIEGA